MIRIIIALITFCCSIGLPQNDADLYRSGMDAYNSKQYAEASRLLEQFFINYDLMDEQYAAAKYFSSDALLNIGQEDAAAAGFEFIVNNFNSTNFREISLYKLGIIYFNKGEYYKCRINFDQLIDEYPETEYTGTARYFIGESFIAENKLDEALSFLKEAVENKRKNKYIDYSIYSLASLYEKTGDYENAVKYYDNLLSYHKESSLAPFAQICIGVCYFKLKDYQSAIVELSNPLLNELPQDLYPQSLYLLANCYYRVQEYENAEKTYLKIIQGYPGLENDKDIRYGLAWAYFQENKYNDAYNIFDFLSAGDDSIAIKSFYWKGEAKRYAGKESEALNIYKEFMKKYPDAKIASGVQYQLGVLSFNEKNFENAESFINDALSSGDGRVRARAYTLQGEIELNKREYDKARQSFEEAINISVTYPDIKKRAMLGFGASLYYLNQYADAVSNLEQLAEIDPSFEKDKANFYLAESYFYKGNYKEAINCYNKIAPSNKELAPSALYGKGYSYFDLRDFDNAVLCFSEFIKKNPKDKNFTDAKMRLADSYYGSKNFTAAGKIYRELFNINPEQENNPYLNYQYAQALFKSGDSEGAYNQFKNIQQRFPESQYADESLYLLGWIRFQQNKYREAISNYRNVLTVYPGSSLAPVIYYSIGDTYFNMEKYDSAIVNYQKLLTSYPSSDYVFDAVNGLQYCYVAKGEPDNAVSLIDEFVSHNPGLSFSDQILFKKGEIYYSQKKYEEAKTSYKQFAADYPKSELIAEAYYWIGKCAQNLKQNDEAVDNFKKVFESYPKSEIAASAVIELGNTYNSMKNFAGAEGIYDKALDKLGNDSPRAAELLYMKGMTLVNKKDYSNAYEVFDEIVLYHKESIFADKAKLELGFIDLAAGRYPNAEMYFKGLADTRSDDLGAKGQYYY
ncbi:MAG TPA: tetratricopeptide repeat protein, partial [Ignavibacteriaceae bacterium]|nr:tetratricopeptide repeat protein [Ignavibacteriaceae bacterium]